MSHNSNDKKRVQALSWMGLGLFAVAGVSQVRLQVLDREAILKRATKTDRFIVSKVEPARRGGIFDREGKPLAQDEDTQFLTVCFDKTPKSPAFYLDLAAATGIPASEFATMSSSESPVDWKQPIGPAQASAVREVTRKWRADGVGLRNSGSRRYPLGEAAAGFLGAMREKTPLSGFELGHNKNLAGMDGKIVGILDREGNYLPMRLDKETVRRRDGATMKLTIDSDLQQAAAEAVKSAVDSNKADQGVAIVMDPKTGDILALANWPSFDPNRAIEPAKGRTPEFNGAYMAALEPGSTFKVLTLAKALDEGVVLPDETYYCRGTMTVGKRTIGCDREHGSHGLLNTESAIARSCNLAAANWALRIGRDDFIDYVNKLGLLEKPGLGLPQESRGLYGFDEPAKQLQVATNGFGQSMNYTPLALCSAFAMLGNDGRSVRPRLVAKIDDREIPVEQGETVVSPEASHTVLRMMRSVFESERGTGHDLRISGFTLGGKTGTAQKTNFSTRSMKGGGHVSNFVGFVPAEDPKAVILVMIDNPKAGKFYGGAVAGPAFKSIAQSVIRRLHVARNDGQDLGLDETKPRISGPRAEVADEPEVVTPVAAKRNRAPKIEVSTRRVRQETEELRQSKLQRVSRPTIRKVEPERAENPTPRARRVTKAAEPVKRSTTERKASPTARTVARTREQTPVRTSEKRPEPAKKTARVARKEPNAPTPPAKRTIRIVEGSAKRSTNRTAEKSASKKPSERPADIQTRRRSAVRLEGGLAPRILTPRLETKKRTLSKSTTKRTIKRDQSPVSTKRVNRDR